MSPATPAGHVPPPPPPPWFAHVVPFHTRVRLVVVLKYSAPFGSPPPISASAYAEIAGPGGFVHGIRIAGGVTLSVCVPPVIVVAGVEKLADVAFGVT